MGKARHLAGIAAAFLVAVAIACVSSVAPTRAGETIAIDRVFLVAEVEGQRFVGETFCERARRCSLDIGRLDLARAVERYDFSADLDGANPTRPMLRIGGGETSLRYEGGLHREIPLETRGTATCASIQAGPPSISDGFRQYPVLRSGTPIGWICIRAEAFEPPR